MKTRLRTFHQQHWATRPLSERKIILAASALILPALVYLLLWQPAQQGATKLHKTLPALHMQAEYMQQWRSNIEELRHRPKIATLDGYALKSSIEDAAVRHQLRSAIDSINAQEPNSVRISLGSVSFALWLDWLRTLQQEQHVRAESIAVTPLNEPGMVSIRATLVSGEGK